MDNYKIGDEVELLEDFYTRSGAEIIFKKGTIAKVIELQLYDEIHIDVNGDNRWCSPDILKLVDKKDLALISGADALRALADGKEVEGFSEENEEWIPIVYFGVQEVVNGLYKFRLKPQTIKLELEIPAPYKAKIGGRDDTSFVLNVGRHQYCYKTEEEYIKARDALEAVFDAAVRGTNS
ncbi:hypothetical protein A1D06_05410 [Acinetobacter baumannii]|uniref:hypothetical protein n=1 Tax=Acinetobacter baumannii TaxID=470 RepID=UPI0007D8A73A|nr:hypothetical protein [Acinetobacter baumannii]OFD27826.1 hypothetical protein A1D06_05410 [Acinetobacter baumannii]